MIEREQIEEIKRQTDIVDVISQFIQLKKVGKNYRALCPFHTEKAPSFYVSPDKGIYYCFGCKKGGNAISFLMEYEHLDFPDALRKLAKAAGIEIDTSKGLKHKELYEVNELACQFYSTVLTREAGHRGMNYLNERKANLEKLKDFRLGYAPSSGGLVAHMKQKSVSADHLNQVGLTSSGREVFHDRIIFPLINLSGRVIGFGGRGIDNYVQPKYLNSPETPIFRKGDNLYGLFQAKETMRLKNEAVLVEGYFDLLSLYQHGIKNICAPLGTALTEKQAVLISRYAHKIHLLFDGDMSGIKAALRAIGLLINAQVDVHVASLPGDTDPDDYIKKHGADSLNALIGEAPDFFHFYKNAVKIQTVEDEVTLIKDLMQIINTIQDPIRYDRYLKHIETVFNLSPETIRKTAVKKEAPANLRESPKSIKATAEERLMAIILNNREYAEKVKDILTDRDFNSEKVKKLFNHIIKNKDAGIDGLSGVVDADLEHTMMELVLKKDERLSEEDFLNAVLSFKNNTETYRLNTLIAEAMKKHDDDEVRRLEKELHDLRTRVAKIPAMAKASDDKGEMDPQNNEGVTK